MVNKNKAWFVVSFLLIAGLAIAANRLSKINTHIEFPIWAVILGIIVRNLRLPEKLHSAATTEFYIKVGLVLLGASVNFAVVMSVGARGIVQALVGVPLVFFFAWFVAGKFGLESKAKAVLSTAVSICGVSAAIAAGGAVVAKKEHLTYVIALVILFALPLMVLVPLLANAMGLPQPVAGAWIGNNIDTTAAVVGAGQIVGDAALKVASVVKMAQNTLIGFAAFLLALYFTFRTGERRPKPVEIWQRFPKFVLGFVIVSILASIGVLTSGEVKALNSLRSWFFAFAFVCIGLSFSFKEMKAIGKRPLAVFAIVTVFNTATALGLSWLLFNDYQIGS
ncbi:MAG: putative sulfate exporter family transporter [Chloroflexi bacterium]|nr:putative sulfate exporter family transporter [Chloroflexota bacterium]